MPKYSVKIESTNVNWPGNEDTLSDCILEEIHGMKLNLGNYTVSVTKLDDLGDIGKP